MKHQAIAEATAGVPAASRSVTAPSSRSACADARAADSRSHATFSSIRDPQLQLATAAGLASTQAEGASAASLRRAFRTVLLI